MIEPLYDDGRFALYCAESYPAMVALAQRGYHADVCIADPPYGETKLAWDKWPDGWPKDVAWTKMARQLWCWGSFRMFLERRDEFSSWTYAQEIIWQKHNGSNPRTDRFRRVHELCVHYYSGVWGELYHQTPTTPDATAKQVRRRSSRPPQWGDIDSAHFASEDGGPRLATSVLYARSAHGRALCEAEKPLDVLGALIEYSCPPGGMVLDLFSGSGSCAEAALRLGRRCVSIEARPEQCDKILQRMAQTTLQAKRES